MKKIALIALAALAVVIGAGAVAWGLTRGDDEQAARGVCDVGAWELSIDDDGGEAAELDIELQSVAPGETWQITVEQGDDVLLEGERVTDEDAELDLDTPVRVSGSDTFTVTATPASGEACVATLTR